MVHLRGKLFKQADSVIMISVIINFITNKSSQQWPHHLQHHHSEPTRSPKIPHNEAIGIQSTRVIEVLEFTSKIPARPQQLCRFPTHCNTGMTTELRASMSIDYVIKQSCGLESHAS